MDNKEKEKHELELLMTSCPELFKFGKAVMFQRFLCPISIVDANVKEYVVDEYDSVELLILRLYFAGIRTVNEISSLTGIDPSMVAKLLFAEKYTYGHINVETGELTRAGMETLKENEDAENLFQHALYDIKRELQVDAITGTLIRAEAEVVKDRMYYYNDMVKPNLLPQEAVVIDETLEREIRERLELYVKRGILANGNTVNNIGSLQTKEIKYRRAFFVYLENFDYPFIAITYMHYNGKERKLVTMPIAIAETDFKKLGITLEECNYLIRANECFDYLKGYKDLFERCPDIDDETMARIIAETDKEYMDNIPNEILDNDDVPNEDEEQVEQGEAVAYAN